MSERVLEIRRAALGEEHANTVLALVNVGVGYFKLGDPARAESLYLEALEIRKEFEGTDDYTFDLALQNYADLLRETGRSGEAAAVEARRHDSGE